MQKNNFSTSAFVIPRVALAFVLFLAAGFLAFYSFAATPSSGTLSEATPLLTYSSGPFIQSNPTGIAGEIICDAVTPCDNYGLTVNVPAAFENTHNIVITVSWPNPGEDYDIYFRQGAPPGTTDLKDAASSSNPEVIVADAVSGQYTIRIVPFAVAGGTTTTTVELREKPVNPPPPPAGTGTPRYHNFAAPAGLGGSAGEPTLAAGSPIPGTQPGGRTMYIAGLETLRVTWNDCSSPASQPGFPAAPALSAPLWEDKSFATTSITSLDPILFGDLETGRIQVSQLGPKTSFLAYTDDDGETYTPTQGSPVNPGVDHQTIGGGPYSPTLEPPHPAHPNALYYASQDIAVAQLGRSDTGGLTYGAAVPMYNLTQCGGLHGHVKVTPRSPLTEANGHLGTVYVPNKGCGGAQAVVVSEDNGVTFAIRPVPGSVGGPSDPSVGIDKAGKIYVAMADGTGRAKVSVSADKGVTWQTATPIDVGVPFGIRNTVFPTAVGGDSGRAAVMFLATDTGGNYEATGVFTGVWHIYAAHTFDGGLSWTTVRVTPANDPVQRGSICTGGTTCGADRNLLDFNDMEIDQEGRIIMAYADGCIGCTSATGADSRADKATIARQSGGRRMLAAFDPQEEPNAAAAPLVVNVSQDGGGVVHLTWREPDNGGAAITGYNVYRREGAAGVYVRLGATAPTTPANKTTFDDSTAVTGINYFYKVTALNSEGESLNCGDFPLGAVIPVESPCALPGITLQVDPANDNTDNPNAQHDIRLLSFAELFDPASAVNKLYVTLKVTNLMPVPQPSSRWTIFFTRADPAPATTSTEWFLAMVTDDTLNPGTPVYRYGHTSIGAGGVRQLTTDGTADSGSITPDGRILITVRTPTRTNMGATGRTWPVLRTGETLSNVNAITQQSGGVLLATVDSTGMGSYVIQGNAVCALNGVPIAALSGTPLTGDAPLTVNFNAGGSSDPDAGDTIVSYTFNFGDGSPEVTQASPTISHTYTDWGNFRATVRVTDSRGAASTNTAAVVGQVGLPLQSIVSRKIHGPTGAFDIDLPLDGTPGIEPRTGGTGGNLTLIYTFDRTVTAPGTASSNDPNANETVVAGPEANQVTVNLTGVANAQNLEVELDNVMDSAGANLTQVKARVGVLVGDTSGDRSVNSADVTQTRRTSGQLTSASNFRTDTSIDGVINSADVTQVRRASGSSLP